MLPPEPVTGEFDGMTRIGSDVPSRGGLGIGESIISNVFPQVKLPIFSSHMLRIASMFGVRHSRLDK